MRASKKADRAMSQLAKMLANHGINQEVIEEVKETAPTDRLAISRQGEAVLLWLESPAKFTTKICKREACGQPFGTNYRSVAYCSDNCRSRDVSTMLGVKWDWTRATEEERWGGEPPLIIPPAALLKIQQYVAFFAGTLATQNQTENLPESTVEFLQRNRQLAEQSHQIGESLHQRRSDSEPLVETEEDKSRTIRHELPLELSQELIQETDEQPSVFDFA